MPIKIVNGENKKKIINNQIYSNLLLKKYNEEEEKSKSKEDALLKFAGVDRDIIVDELVEPKRKNGFINKKEKELGFEFLKYNKFSIEDKKEIFKILNVDEYLIKEIFKEKIEIKIQEQELELEKLKILKKNMCTSF